MRKTSMRTCDIRSAMRPRIIADRPFHPEASLSAPVPDSPAARPSRAGADSPGHGDSHDGPVHVVDLAADAAGRRFDATLAAALPQYSRSRLRAWIDAGRVTVDGVVPDPTQKVRGDEHVVVRALAESLGASVAAEAIALTVIHGVATLLACRLETGRTHQIRVHLASLGHPLVGDPAYGKRSAVRFGRQALHAARLALVHPATGALRTWESPLPADFAELLVELRGRPAR